MPAAVLFLGISTFVLCLAAHILLWRVRCPKQELPALLFIFFILGFLLLSGLRGFFGPLSGTDWIAAVLLHVALSCGYIQLYPASQAESPSVRILAAVSRSMPQGMSESEIRALMDPEKAMQVCVDDLARSGLVCHQNGTLSLTPRGSAFISPFMIYRRMLGIPEGKG